MKNNFYPLGRYFGGIFSAVLGITRQSSYSFWQNNTSPVLVDVQNLLQVYSACPHVQIVIDKRAKLLTNGVLKKRNKKTKVENTNATIPDFISNPNPLQSHQEFIYNWSILNDIYSCYYIYPNKPFNTSAPKALWNLLPEQLKITPTGKIYDQVDIAGIIEKIELLINGSVSKTFKPNELIFGTSGVSKIPFLAQSKLISLQLPISNIVGALKTRNKFIFNGPKVIISSDSKDSDGGVPMGDPERIKIEQQMMRDYGIGDAQSQAIISTAKLSSQRIDYPTKDLMLFEEEEGDFASLCAAYDVDRDVFPSTKGATFENKEKGERATYQNAIFPIAKTLCDIFNELDTEDSRNEYYYDFSHLPVLMENKLNTANENKINVQAYSQMYRDGIISAERYSELCGEQTLTGDGNIKGNSQQQNNIDPNGNPTGPSA